MGRLIYFDYRGVREALSTSYNESGQQGDRDVGGGQNMSLVPHSEFLANIRKDWYDILARYSTCSLNNASDKLVAILGIALCRAGLSRAPRTRKT